jgi:N-acetylglucosaminyl-diphospho-decaprenol L-rhamnosyltransferase
VPRDHRAVELLVLNYNGRDLLAECLPSLVDAAAHSSSPCRLIVVDNSSTDGSAAFLAENYQGIEVVPQPNFGLASLNEVVVNSASDVVLLLNSDVKLDRYSIDPLVRAVRENPDALFAAPCCWTFDGHIYEGMRTRIQSRYGIVQGLCRVPGHEATIELPGLTASAGPVLAVHRGRFVSLGGYDPLYFPGRIEDLDLCYRAYLAGWKGYYVPESICFHRGFGSFDEAVGREGCDQLAYRNTLLFTWKNLRGLRLISHLCWLPVRLIVAVIRGQFGRIQAFFDALARVHQIGDSSPCPVCHRIERQEQYFRDFAFPIVGR